MLTIQVINLRRRPDRRKFFEHWNTQEHLQIEWVEAIDGQQLSFMDLVRDGIVLEQADFMGAGPLGIACSQKLLWERAVRENQTLIICEDDAILRGDFVQQATTMMDQLPSQWDFLLFGYNFNTCLDVEIFPGQRLMSGFSPTKLPESEYRRFVDNRSSTVCLPLKNAFGTHAYAITPKGANYLLRACFPLAGIAVEVPALKKTIYPSVHLDSTMNAYYQQIHAYCAFPPLTITPLHLESSDTLNSQPLPPN